MNKIQCIRIRLPKNLSCSNWTQIRLKMGSEMLTGTKQRLVKVKSIVPRTFLGISGTQSYIQRFKRNANQTLNGREMASGLLCDAAGLSLLNRIFWLTMNNTA